MEEYNLKPLIQNGRILAECRTCIYGLPQEGRFAYIKIVKHLAGECYFPTINTAGIFHHLTRPTALNLVVDEFGAKIVGNTFITILSMHFKNTTT